MKNVFDVPAGKLIAATAEKLKSVPELKPPAWIHYVKSGAHKERAPEQPDFWYMRCASILRQIYLKGPVGVSIFRRHFGGAKGHTVQRSHKTKAGGNIIRKSLQALEKAGLVDRSRAGRSVTAKGKAFVDGVARHL